MTIELTSVVEEQLRDLADKQGRALEALVEEAVRDDLVAVAMTDVTSTEVAETQMRMASEIADLDEWKDGRE